MLHKCANPSCENAFLKLTQGKLFLVETDPLPAEAPAESWIKTRQRHIQHYWLCDTCAPVLTLAYERGRGIVAVPVAAQLPKMPPASQGHADLASCRAAADPVPYLRRA